MPTQLNAQSRPPRVRLLAQLARPRIPGGSSSWTIQMIRCYLYNVAYRGNQRENRYDSSETAQPWVVVSMTGHPPGISVPYCRVDWDTQPLVQLALLALRDGLRRSDS